ncbi:MAG: hypothetical protein JSW58_07765 [Candidatus Latescibacterota bacterium]|nr:MAG: hypothetical protein JSW58_07765 [Candidatus Latescibacterota bacterium]
MRAVLAIAAILAIVMLLPASADAQPSPTVRVYFDEDCTQGSKDCPVGGGTDIAYVVAMDFAQFISGVEYSIVYPASMIWLADLDTPPVTVGSTPTGISEAWAIPQDGVNGFLVARIQFQWNCNGCTVENDPVQVRPHPMTGKVRATNFPDYDFIDATGMTALVCSTVATDETTWSRIKAMFTD